MSTIVYIDADGCPVVDEAVTIAKRHGFPVVIVCDTSHIFEKDGVKTLTVGKGRDSADFAIVNQLSRGDIVVTQDYGLAAMCLARTAKVINQNGLVYTSDNILPMLEARAFTGKIRRTSPRTKLKGPKKRTASDDYDFEAAFERLLLNNK